ncbi:hypothetical protein AN960_04845 [Bacillus sp. FJAT-25509]|uniref:helix-turn-helix domain-containing protein n=1 Tax=Bacillus sp. FJAT-25509 TaxID=1712029 RepID=UPI0006FDD44A|nr:helix-turn-helix transcriptional regulator [Bacillus sp. FJAT-25509]KQL41311.1 hypothetical protein AN960_04845 [Bacillus sp. FJAT-25509]
MQEGEIIKFYRKRAGLTQEELGKDICTSTHVSRIERGETQYSKEIIELFSERLKIDIQNELNYFNNIEKKLNSWHTSIIKQNMIEVEKAKKDIEKNYIINFSKYAPLFQLLQARYYLLQNEFEKTKTILKDIQKKHPDLPPFEKNLKWLVWGILYGKTDNYEKSIQVLKNINKSEFGNLEYYIYLSLGYYQVNPKSIMTYVYAEKALKYFKKTYNYLRAIDAEAILLLIKGNEKSFDFQEVLESYHNLIEASERVNALDRKILLQNNLADLYLKRKDFENAQILFKVTLDMVDRSSYKYVKYLYNYLESSFLGNLLQKNDLLKKANEGKAIAEKLDSSLFKILFRLLIYLIEDKLDQYYIFMEKTALIYLQSVSNMVVFKTYVEKLYNNYIETKNYAKAINLSKFILEENI